MNLPMHKARSLVSPSATSARLFSASSAPTTPTPSRLVKVDSFLIRRGLASRAGSIQKLGTVGRGRDVVGKRGIEVSEILTLSRCPEAWSLGLKAKKFDKRPILPAEFLASALVRFA